MAAPGLATPICDQLSAADWDVHRAPDLRTARRLTAGHRFSVGLLLHTEVDDALCAELDGFLAANGNLEWIGGFDAA